MFALLILALAAPSLPFSPASVSTGGFTNDGNAVFWNAWAPHSPGARRRMNLVIVTDRDGSIQSVFRTEDCAKREDDCDAPQAAWTAWSTAGSVEDGRRWSEAHPLVPPTLDDMIDGELKVPGGRDPLALMVVSDRARCPTYTLVATFGALRGVLAEDPCRKGEEASRGVGHYVTVAWSPDGARAAIAWNPQRSPPQGVDGDEWDQPSRGYMLMVTRRTLASIDLLDAGAGKKLDALANKLTEAKFRVGHRGKAGTPRKKTELYFAPAFEPEAKELVKLLGLPESAAQPLTWKTPYSLTIAAGSGG